MYLQLKNYFEELVQNSEFLGDFAGYFARELHNKEQSYNGINSPFLVLFNYSVGIEGEEMATSKGIRKLSFGVLRNDVPPDDYEAQYQAIDEMEQLALKIASRMRFDSNNTRHFLYGAFQKNTLEIRPVELEGDGIFGVEVSFALSSKQSLKLSPDDWKDIDKVC